MVFEQVSATSPALDAPGAGAAHGFRMEGYVLLNLDCIRKRFRIGIRVAALATLLTSCDDDPPTSPSPGPAPSNSAPVADAGVDRTAAWRDTVWLDASSSHDMDGDLLTYQWDLLAQPAGSGAVLANPTTITPHLVADASGEFMLQLVVNDGSTASAPDTVTITVDPVAAIATSPTTVGAGLQATTTATLGISDHGGTTVRITSGDPQLALIASDENAPGSAFIDVTVPDGTDLIPFVVQGTVGASGATPVTISATGFTDGAGTITVVPPAVIIDGLESTHWSVAPDSFNVLIGIPDSTGMGMLTLQTVSAANVAPLTMTIISTNAAVGHVAAGAAPASSITVDLDPAQSQRSATFLPLTGGTTTVTASIPGFVVTAGATVDVNVSVPAIDPFSHTIGAGLQFGGEAHLDTGDHGGVTVHIESSDPATALVAPDLNTPGSQSIDVVVADGVTLVPYVVQGVPSAAGSVTITAAAPGFATGARTVTVVQPALTILALSDSQVVGISREFSVLLGLPNLTGDGISSVQGVSAAAAPLIMTVSSTNGPVGHVSGSGTTGSMVTIDLTAGVFQPQAVFVPLSGGTTTVAASIPGFISTTGASVPVTVHAAEITLFNRTIGAGLQYGREATLTTDTHGGITLRIESGNPSVALIAPDVNTPGSAFIDVFVPDGEDEVPYVVQGVVGATGLVTVTATAPGFTAGTGQITVVQPAIMITGLKDTVGVGENDTFSVLLGLSNLAGDGLSSIQGISAASTQPVVLTLMSSDGAVADLSAGGPAGDAITVDLFAGAFDQGAALRAWAPGTTTVSASIPGFLALTTATTEVTVIP